MHLCVVGQAAVGQGHSGGQLGVGAVGAMRPQQRVVLRQGFAIDEGLGDGAALGQFGLDPVRVDVAPVTGDELMLLAAFEVEKTVVVERAEVTAGPPLFGLFGLAQIAEQGRAFDQHLVVFGEADLHMGSGWPTLPARWAPGRLRHTTEAHSDRP